MRKVLVALLLACSNMLMAQVPTMEVKNASLVRDFALSDVRKISFDPTTDAMVIDLTNSSPVSYAIAQIQAITFLNMDAPAAIVETEIPQDSKHVQKVLRNGRLKIIKDGKEYDLTGRRLY